MNSKKLESASYVPTPALGPAMWNFQISVTTNMYQWTPKGLKRAPKHILEEQFQISQNQICTAEEGDR